MDAEETIERPTKQPRSRNAEYISKWRRENREKRRAQKRRVYWKDVVATRTAKRQYYYANREKILKQLSEARLVNHWATLETQKEFRVRNPEKIKTWRQNHRKNNRGAYVFQGIQKKCRETGMECDITPAWIQAKLDFGFCEMSGLPFDMETKRGANSPSVDRIDPKGPYTKANCRVILWSINRALCNYGEDYLLGVFERILERRDVKVAA